VKLALASDHAGFPLKDAVLLAIAAAGHEAVDLAMKAGR
jgi:ribose 5-phosphate isomerase RpiB